MFDSLNKVRRTSDSESLTMAHDEDIDYAFWDFVKNMKGIREGVDGKGVKQDLC